MQREKVIYALRCVGNGSPSTCSECSYYNSELCCCNLIYIIKDALVLLEEQEARVMTLEELDDYRKTEEGADPYITSEKTPVMVEYSSDVPYNTRWLTIESLNSWLDYRDMRVIYGKEWRAWSARPTEEQRKAAKWDET